MNPSRGGRGRRCPPGSSRTRPGTDGAGFRHDRARGCDRGRLEDEEGRLFYEIEVETDAGDREVLIDLATGDVLAGDPGD